MQIKKAMRSHHLELRKALSDQDRMQKSEAIVQRIRAVPEVTVAEVLLSYVSAGSEVNTHGLVASALQAGIEVWVPLVHGESLVWSKLNRFADLDLSLPVPAPRRPDLGTPDAHAPVIVPGVAFDRAGNRLGRGKGHFDRFLRGHSGPKIGLAFDVQVTGDLPTEPHDVPMDYLVMESGVMRFED